MGIISYEQKKTLGSSVDDFIFTRLAFEDSRPKKLVFFCVIQVYVSGEEHYETIKFDAAHGSCHVHRYYRDLGPHKDTLEDMDISQANFEKCKKDVLDNWETYKSAYIKKWLGGNGYQ